MFLEYFNLLDLSEQGPLSFEFLSRIATILITGVVLTLVGFKIRGTSGAIIALLVGVGVFLYINGVISLRF
jgi:hypothetical protein